MNQRRRLIAALGIASLASTAWSQKKIPRVGFFYFASNKSAVELGRYPKFIEGMRELGYEEGRDFTLIARYADSNEALAEQFAAEFVRDKVDVIVATGSPVYDALKRAKLDTPVVFTVGSDPVATGMVKSLARPASNFTGLSENNSEVVTKHLQLLQLAVPGLKRLAVLANPTNAARAITVKQLETATKRTNISLMTLESSTFKGNEQAFAAIARERIEALIILNDTFFAQQSQQLAQLSIKYRVASIFGTQDYAPAGGLMSYGPEIREQFRRAAGYVDKILKGTKAADLPVERPTLYLLTVNKKTAKAIGRTLPPELLFRADKVIE